MPIKLLRENSYAEIVFDKAPANAYDFDFHQKLNTILDELESYKTISVVVIKSNIEKFFCAGADLKVFGQNTKEVNDQMVALAQKATHKIENSDKIYVAAIAGHCLGGGLELAMACDIRLAKEGKFLFGLPEINIGLIPGNGGTQRLLRIVGPTKALEILLARENFGPEKAMELGLINKLIASHHWKEEMKSYCENLAAGPPLAMTATKKAVTHGTYLNINEGLKLEQRLLNPLQNSEDYKEGIKAFNEKRKPIFKGK